MKRQVTVIEVAREAGVSPSTVSRVLNGRAHVVPEKRRAVEQAIQRLGYQPNVVARSLVTGASHTIGVLTQDVASPFYNNAVRGIEFGLLGTGYHPLILSGHWRTRDEDHALDVLLSRKIDALIVLGGRLPTRRLAETARQLPVIVLGRHVDTPDFPGSTFTMDNLRGAHLAVRHLTDLGHRHIAHVMGLPDHADTHQRLAGYRQALRDADIPEDHEFISQGDFQTPSGLLAVDRILESGMPITAIFAANDQMAYGARLALYRRGIRVPEDMSLVGFDDLPGSEYTTPPLTSVRQPMYDLGFAVAQHLTARLNGKHHPITPPDLELVIRESTARLR